MRFHIVFSVLFLLCGLIVLGCGDSVEESDADLLEPSEDFRFQELPVVEGGSLIPPDEVPVITIEKTREDAENIWWRLKANPAPSREDLVVHVIGPTTNVPRRHSDAIFLAILKFENDSIEWASPREVGGAYTISINLVKFEWSPNKNPSFADLGNFPGGTRPAVLDDGYVVPPIFRYHYYIVGKASELTIPAQE